MATESIQLVTLCRSCGKWILKGSTEEDHKVAFDDI